MHFKQTAMYVALIYHNMH